jgi:RNA polymerase sigma factor (sigma-70 family)
MSRQLAAVIHWIRHVAASGRAGAGSDQQLLDRFIGHRDEEAFAALVLRHGPMVLAVCRRVLSDSHDAEDAFQATFLVLVRKAASIAKRSSVGSWLHGVAYRIAAKARAQRCHRRSRESEMTDMPAAEPSPELLWQDVRAVLDEEVARLPEKYRAPFLLCYLEGKTNEEASQHLGCPKGTVATRLARAREVLRERLGHRGVTLSAALLGTLLAEKVLPAAVPGSLAGSTVQAAMLVAAGGATAGVISAGVASLMESGVRSMAISKMKIALAACLAVATVGMSAGILTYQIAGKERTAEDKPATDVSSTDQPKAAPAQPRTDEDTITGIVVDADGRPVKDVEVRAYLYGARLEKILRTDGQGQVQVPKKWDNRDSNYTMIVEMGDRLGWYSLPDYSADNQGKPVSSFRIRVLPRTKTIQGTLVDSKGRPLSRVAVKVQVLDGASYYPPTGKDPLGEAVTDAQGRYSLRVPEFSHCQLVPVDPGIIRKRLIARPNQLDLGRVTVADAGAISGRVIDARSGRPVAGATVGAQLLSFSDYESGGFGDAQTDDEGRYTIVSLTPGLYNVLFQGSPDQPKITAAAQEAVRVEVGKKTSADFRAVEGRLLAGKVVGKEDNKPIPNCNVDYYGSARPRSGAACMMIRTDAEGNFRFYVPPGTAYVCVAEDRGPVIPESSRTLEVAADKDPEEVQLVTYSQKQSLGVTYSSAAVPEGKEDHSYQLLVRLRAKNGKPVVGANIWLWRKGATTWSQWNGEAGEDRNIPLGGRSDGEVYFLIIEAEGWARPRPPQFVVAKVMKPLVIDMEPASYVPVRGKVVDREGKPIAKALVRAGLVLSGEATQFPWGVEPLTDGDGRFELKRLRPQDRFTIQISKKGYAALSSKQMVVAQGQALDLGTFTLLALGQSAEAVVGKPAPGFPVSKWVGKGAPARLDYAPQDFRGKVVLLAFLDEARPSERLLPQLNSLHEKLEAKGLAIIRVYESGATAELAKLSPTVAALASPGLRSEGSSRAAESFAVKARPTLFLVDRKGIVRDADIEPGRLQERLDILLNP